MRFAFGKASSFLKNPFEEFATELPHRNFEGWVEDRQRGIGGSDAGAIMGVDPYRTQLDVYRSKTEEPKPATGANSQAFEAAHWGSVMEDPIAQEFANRSGLLVESPQFFLQSKLYPFMLATLDRVVLEPNNMVPPTFLEIKTRSIFKSREYSLDPLRVEPKVLMQCYHYMVVTGTQTCHIAVLFGGQKLEWYFIERDPNLAANLIEIESRFWEFVLKREPPPKKPERSSPAPSEELVVLLEKHKRISRVISELDSVRVSLEDNIRRQLPEDYPFHWKARQIMSTPVLKE